MRLLVVSDSHGYDEELEFVLKNITYDAAIHCGDCHFDKKSSFLKYLMLLFKEIMMKIFYH